MMSCSNLSIDPLWARGRELRQEALWKRIATIIPAYTIYISRKVRNRHSAKFQEIAQLCFKIKAINSRMPGIMVKAVVIVAEITIFMNKKDRSEFLA
jgi:hypothetical protein